MIDKRIKLEVLHDDNGTFLDVSDKVADYLRDTAPVEIVAAEDFVYVGFRKAISAVYVELDTPNTNASKLIVQAHNGTSFADIESQDETVGMTRNGFVSWDRADVTSTEVNSETMYWVRFAFSGDTTAMVIQGLNLVFSDDQQLKTEFDKVLDPRILGSGVSTHIVKHVAARNHIVQSLRNDGYIKHNSSTGVENINQWDLLDIFEIREAATFKALSDIFFILSDSTEDNWWYKHLEYNKRFTAAFATAKLSIDLDDDGQADAGEKLTQRKSLTWDR